MKAYAGLHGALVDVLTQFPTPGGRHDVVSKSDRLPELDSGRELALCRVSHVGIVVVATDRTGRTVQRRFRSGAATVCTPRRSLADL
jgi:hypothetical protein